MPISLGSLPVSKIYLGLNEIDVSYLGRQGFPEQDLVFTVDSSLSEFSSISLSLNINTPINIIVDWGDGSPNYIKDGLSNGFPVLHEYAVDGMYEVRVSGSSEYISLNGNETLISVQNLGTFGIADRPSMFLNCSNLASVNFGSYVTSIGDEAFYDCSSLTSVTIPNSVTSIGLDAFYFCSSLTSITIPNSVTSIGNTAFFNCGSLATVDLSLPKSVIDTAAGIFINTASPLTLNVPVGTTGWTAGTGQSIGGNTNVTVNLV